MLQVAQGPTAAAPGEAGIAQSLDVSRPMRLAKRTASLASLQGTCVAFLPALVLASGAPLCGMAPVLSWAPISPTLYLLQLYLPARA